MRFCSELKKYLLRAAAAVCGSVFGWAVIENTALLCVSRYTADIPGLPRIVQISDLHKRQFGRHQKRLIRRVRSLNPEIIVITGDLVSRDVTDFTGTEQLLRQLSAIAPVITANGNHEGDLTPENYAAFCRAVRRGGAVLLENEAVTCKGIRFAGLFLPRPYFRGGGLLGFSGEKDCTAADVTELLGPCTEQTVLLAHNPLFFPAYAEWGAALTLSGHIHGGAVRLPGIGGLLSPARKFMPRYDKGCFRIGEQQMIVSGGLGKLRLFNPPELCLITEKTT